MKDNFTQIAFFSPREFQKSLLQNESRVHYIEFLPLDGWFIDNELIANCPSLNSTFFDYFDEVLNRLIKSGPIFSRHHDDLPSMEIVLRSTTLTILAIAEKMSALLTEEYLKERASKGNKNVFLKALKKVPDNDPEDFDRL